MLKRMIEAFKSALFPSRCQACGAFFDSRTSFDNGKGAADTRMTGPLHRHLSFDRVMAPHMCKMCLSEFLPVQSPVCTMCGALFKSREGEDHLCGPCIGSPKHFKAARSVGVYDQALLSLVHGLKYKGKIQLARPLGLLMFAAFFRFWLPERIDALVPVPLHPKRFRQRGFNQVYLLLSQWPQWERAYAVGQPVPPVDRQLLVRRRCTDPQTGLGRKARETNIKNAFEVADGSGVKTRRFLLVDDVYTTGATANECARVLMGAGARRVDVLTLARAL